MGTAAQANDPQYLDGEITSEAFSLNVGEVLVATDDLRITSSGTVVLDGLLIADAGVSIDIVADEIRIRGMIRAGDGRNRSRLLEHGEDGGSISIEARHVDLAGTTIQAGSGGNAGPAGDAGNGGDVSFVNVEHLSTDTSTTIEGGSAGNAGAGINGFGERARSGGNGGRGGGVHRVGNPVEPADADNDDRASS